MAFTAVDGPSPHEYKAKISSEMSSLLAQKPIDGLDVLPPLTDAELQAISEETSTSLEELLANKSTLSPETLRSYSSALRYWDAWHRASMGTQLPLLRSPRDPVASETVAAFIAHHFPRSSDHSTELAMPAFVLARLRQIGAIGKRLASKRTGARITDDVPTLATIEHRIAALSACHRLANVVAEFTDSPIVHQARRTLKNHAAITAPAMLRKPKVAVTRDVLTRMLETCQDDGLRGIRDAAILHVGFHGGGRRRSEIVNMLWADLTPIQPPELADVLADGYSWKLWQTKGCRRDRADKRVVTIHLPGFVARAIERWRDACVRLRVRLDGPVWYRLIQQRAGEWWPSTPMIAEDIRQVVRVRAIAAGLDADDFAAHSIRSGAATTFLEEGGQLAQACCLLDHSSIVTTRKHCDQRDVRAGALARLASRHLGPGT